MDCTISACITQPLQSWSSFVQGILNRQFPQCIQLSTRISPFYHDTQTIAWFVGTNFHRTQRKMWWFFAICHCMGLTVDFHEFVNYDQASTFRHELPRSSPTFRTKHDRVGEAQDNLVFTYEVYHPQSSWYIMQALLHVGLKVLELLPEDASYAHLLIALMMMLSTCEDMDTLWSTYLFRYAWFENKALSSLSELSEFRAHRHPHILAWSRRKKKKKRICKCLFVHGLFMHGLLVVYLALVIMHLWLCTYWNNMWFCDFQKIMQNGLK